MDFQVRITEAALADLDEILDYSWARFPDNKERFANAILNHLYLLKSFPSIGARWPDVLVFANWFTRRS